MTTKHNCNPRGVDHEFEVGDLVILDRVTSAIPHLENKTGTVLSEKTLIPFEDDQTISAYAVKVDDQEGVVIVYAPEMDVRPENNRNAVGRSTIVTDANGAPAKGVYVSPPRSNESGTFQIVELEDGSFVIDQTA